MYWKRSPDRNTTTEATKSKVPTFCCQHENFDHVCTCTAYKPIPTWDLIKPARQIPPSLRLAVEKVQVIETFTSAKPWSAAARSVTEAVDTEAAAAAPAAPAAEDVHSIGHVAPYRCVSTAHCGRRSARGQLTPAIGLAKVAQMFWNYKQSIDLRWLRKNQSRFSV